MALTSPTPSSAHPARFGRLLRSVVAGALLLGSSASTVSAETLMMPNRDMLRGTSEVVWGVTTLPNYAAATPTTYSIDFGDGSLDATGNVTDRSYLAVNHTYADAGTFTATLTVTGVGITETATVEVRVFDPAVISAEQLRGVNTNRAIENGLRYLWVNQASRGPNFPDGVTTNWGSSYPQSFAALIVLAFENHGYLLPNNNSAPTGLYQKYIVRRGLNFVIDQLQQMTLTAQTAGDPCVGVDDGPAPCVGLRQALQQEGYATSLAILPLAASNALNRNVTEITGSMNTGFVVGRTYRDILQRLVNAMAYGQGESGDGRGGWYYYFNAGGTDGSTIGWNVLALLDSEAAGITVPAFVKSEFTNFAIPAGLNTDGTFDYSANTNAAAPGGISSNAAKAGIGVQAMFYADMVGLGNARVVAGRNSISNRWNGPVGGDSYACTNGQWNKGCGYAMFNIFKALKLQGISTLPGVTRPAGPGAIPAGDWYADYVDWLLANQTAPTTTTGGHWAGLSFSCCGDGVVGSAALAELILSPVALIAPDPTLFSTVGLSPATATNAPFGTHTITATATSAGGAAVAGSTVNFSVLTGPNAGQVGQGVTNTTGQATFTYTDTGGPGTDTVQAFIGTLGSNVVQAIWQVPSCQGAAAVLASPMFPIDQGWRAFTITGVSNAAVTQVCQDEAPNFENVASWAVDATGIGTTTGAVRAQRSGTRTAPSNGRVYRIYYTAASCVGSVTIEVPTVAGGLAIDNGPLYNSVTGAPCSAPLVPTVVAAPNVVGQSQAAAFALISGAGLVPGAVSTLASPTVPAGSVMSQVPSAGVNVAVGSAVVLTVSSGPPLVAVPNVVGQTEAAAGGAVSGAGLVVGAVSQVNHASIAAGVVISQLPIGGTNVAPGSAVALTVSLGPALSVVPNVVGQTQAAAVSAIAAVGLNFGSLSQVYDGTIAVGLVISQSPAGGTSVPTGSAVNLTLSLGPQPVPVPNVVGQTEAAARASIIAGTLAVGTVTQVNHASVPIGQVISQAPAAGTSVLPGSLVTFAVSLGPVMVTVPPVVGQAQAAAAGAITGVGLVVGTVSQVNDAVVPAGSVISQAPMGGASVVIGSAVALTVSLGPTPVPVPNVVGQEQATAASNITAATLTVGTVTQANSATVPAGSVISQSPVAGTSVLPGSAVNLTVSLGPVMVPVPNVVGETQAAATATIAGVSLTASATFASDPVIEAGRVISQSPVAGTSVAEGSAVSITVSTGVAVSVVPNVLGQLRAAAEAAITAADLVPGTVTEANHPSVPAGAVSSQTPSGGANAAPGSAVDLVVSLGPAPAVPASLTLDLSSLVIGSGASSLITSVVRDAFDTPVAPLPPITYSIVAGLGSTGTAPTVSGGQVVTAADTRGAFTLHGSVDGSSVEADREFVVVDGAAQSSNTAKFVNLGLAEAAVAAGLNNLLDAYQAPLGTPADVAAARTALTAALLNAPITGRHAMQRSTAVAPEVGFLPSTGALTAAGFPLTAGDIAFGNLIAQLSAKLTQVTAFYNNLNPDGTAGLGDSVQQLNTLNAELAALQAQLNTIIVTPHGVVRYAPQINRLMGNIIPAHLHAVTGRVVSVTLQYPDPGNVPPAVARLPGAREYFAGLQTTPQFQTPGGFYGRTRPAFFGLLGLMGGSSLQMKLVNDVYGPIMKEVSQMIAVLAANSLLTAYLDTVSLGDLVSGGSLSFHAPGLGGSAIEGYGFDTTNVAGNDVFFIGPEAFDAAQNLITAFNPGEIESLEDVYDYFSGIIDALEAAGAAYDNAHSQPDGLGVGQCLLDDGGGCTALYYNAAGFPDVNSTRFPSPVIVLLHNMNNGGWSSGIFNFVP